MSTRKVIHRNGDLRVDKIEAKDKPPVFAVAQEGWGWIADFDLEVDAVAEMNQRAEFAAIRAGEKK